MKYTISLFILVFTISAQAKIDLKVGDILLQPLDCWTCNLIEDEEQTIYSHMGIVMAVDPVLVADSRDKVKISSLEDFDSITEKSQRIAVLRFHNAKLVNHLHDKRHEFLNLFRTEFEGLDYDHDFRWHNFDEAGREKLYCSEMVAKLLQAFTGMEPINKRMHFSRNREIWERYFKGDVPVGEWGNAPGDFERSHHFYKVGEL